MRWIIGGTSGIGAATADIFAQYDNGSIPLVSDARDCDVRDSSAVRGRLAKAVHACRVAGEPLKTIIYSAGVNELAFLGTMGEDGLEDAADVIDVNLMGFIRVLDAVMDPAIFPEAWRKGLAVIAITSDAAERPMRTSTAYCASKAGLNMAIKTSARELASHGIRVLGLAPGMTEGTGMTDYIDTTVPKLRGWTEEQAMDYEVSQEVTPGRVMPGELAVTILMMVNGPRHWTGDIVTVNGGR